MNIVRCDEECEFQKNGYCERCDTQVEMQSLSDDGVCLYRSQMKKVSTAEPIKTDLTHQKYF